MNPIMAASVIAHHRGRHGHGGGTVNCEDCYDPERHPHCFWCLNCTLLGLVGMLMVLALL